MDNTIFSPLRIDEILGFREPQARATTPPVNSSTQNILAPPVRADEILGIIAPQPREITPPTEREKSPPRIRESYDHPPKPHILPEKPSPLRNSWIPRSPPLSRTNTQNSFDTSGVDDDTSNEILDNWLADYLVEDPTDAPTSGFYQDLLLSYEEEPNPNLDDVEEPTTNAFLALR
jgi:hypothetical protein